MSKEFEKWFSEKFGEWNLEEENGFYAEYGWNAARDKILQLLQENKHEVCSHGYDAGLEYVYLNDVKEIIEKL